MIVEEMLEKSSYLWWFFNGNIMILRGPRKWNLEQLIMRRNWWAYWIYLTSRISFYLFVKERKLLVVPWINCATSDEEFCFEGGEGGRGWKKSVFSFRHLYKYCWAARRLLRIFSKRGNDDFWISDISFFWVRDAKTSNMLSLRQSCGISGPTGRGKIIQSSILLWTVSINPHFLQLYINGGKDFILIDFKNPQAFC